ncbi:hypothetical protein [Herbiconiux sp. A18JL235]|uniref:SHOCT domain-containing protein n=1 Tax=Herbiconiux sp. A18JL235 TaxID=3152363 RepID=A0AB39BIV5_9MICO
MQQLTELFPILFVVAAAIIAVVIAVIVVQAVANARAVRRAGHNPLTLQADLATRLLDSQALSAARSTEERLDALDRMRDERSISDDEYREARARVLSDH